MRDKILKAHPLSVVETVDSRLVLRVLTDFRKGDFSAHLPVDSTGVAGKVYDTINEIIDLNARLTKELERISTVVGKEGKIRQRVALPGAAGGWADCVDSVNSLVSDLIQPITDVSRVIGAVAKGDLSQTMDLEVEGRHLTGEFLRTAKTVNTMVDQLSTFASEVIRVAREVGTEGKLGGQAKVKGVSGAWKDLTDNVNSMAANLTNQVRKLEEKARQLFQQNKEVERKNAEIEKARASLEEKAAQLALTSKYKSEFLANMSHELRTPLNSMLILSRLLWENQDKNLSENQIEYAQTIHASGDDLLQLINEILDLSKVESGTMEIDAQKMFISEIRGYVQKNFEAVVCAKGLSFSVDVRKTAPRTIVTDQGRLQQILKNLLSNAFKFTHDGSVTLRIETAEEGWSVGHKSLDAAEQVVAFSVTDTGIGIPAQKHRIIFEAFQQADGTITRKYGGTGLGLSISREIAQLLGGEIRVTSEPEKGSTFTLYLPRLHDGGDDLRNVPAEPFPIGEEGSLADDRESIQDGDRVMVVVDPGTENWERLSAIGRQQGFKVVVETHAENAFSAVREFDADAIILAATDETWVILDRLKHDLQTRHIPVHVIGGKDDRRRTLNLAAFSFIDRDADGGALARSVESLKAFVDRRTKRLLVVEDDENQRNSIVELIGNEDVETTAVATGCEALQALRSMHFDCMVVDLGLPDMSGFDILDKLKKEPGLHDLPVIVYTAKAISKKEETRLRQVSESIVLKDARTPERLLAETSLFLHRVPAKLSASKRRILEDESNTDPVLPGKKVLVIDDDVRNIFSLTSLLERHHMEVIFAENGRDGIELLKEGHGVDAILVDVMMPEMDGYETMREIRKMHRFKSTPIIALTAKAMRGDREKCVESGASDDVAKPADVDRLLSLLRMYLGK